MLEQMDFHGEQLAWTGVHGTDVPLGARAPADPSSMPMDESRPLSKPKAKKKKAAKKKAAKKKAAKKKSRPKAKKKKPAKKKRPVKRNAAANRSRYKHPRERLVETLAGTLGRTIVLRASCVSFPDARCSRQDPASAPPEEVAAMLAALRVDWIVATSRAS